jgi:threonine 3-dehydrogenase
MVLRDVPVPSCGPSDALIRVHHAGVCGTDLHIWEWDSWASGRLRPPVIIGHEFAGEIVQLGREAESAGLLAVGDSVTAEGHIVCGHCLQCRLGAAHLCQRTQIIGVDRDGAFAEFIVMPASNVMRLDGISTEVGAIMDPLGNAVHTVLEADVPGSRVLVLGCGPIGCFAVGDFNPMRLALARQMGAHVTLDPGSDDVLARVRDLTGGDGVDLVCEMSGHPSGHAQAFAAARLGGRVNLLGTPSRTTEVDFARDVIFKGLTLYGVTGRKMYQTWDEMRRFLRCGQLDPRPVITHRFPLESIAEAIQVIKDGQAGKVILEIGT